MQQRSWHPATLVWTVSSLSPRTMSTSMLNLMLMKMWTKSRTLLCRAYSPGEDDILSHESRSVEHIFNKTCTSYHYSKYFIHGVNYPSIDNVNIEAEDNVDLSVDLDVGENVNKSLTLLCRAFSPGEDDILSQGSLSSVRHNFAKSCTNYCYFIHLDINLLKDQFLDWSDVLIDVAIKASFLYMQWSRDAVTKLQIWYIWAPPRALIAIPTY